MMLFNNQKSSTKKTSKKKTLFLIIGYLIFIVFIFECIARLAFLIPQVSTRLQEEEDYSWRRAWVKRHQKFNREIFYKHDIYDPSKGWRSKPNLRDVKFFNGKTLSTNSHGFRGKQDFPYARDKRKLRILILGDSFTFGDGVNDDETYSYYLQQMLPGTEVINMGVHGYGHDQMLILFKEVGVRYKPDIVILGFLAMDMHRNLLQFRDYAKPRFILEEGNLKLINTPVPPPEKILRWDWLRPRIFEMISLIRHKIRIVSGQYEQDVMSITSAILDEMIYFIKKNRAVPVIVYLPYGEEISGTTDFIKSESYMLSLCQMNDQAKCFSTRSAFAEKIAEGKSFKTNGHWGPAEHLTGAQAIRNYLRNEKLILCLEGKL